MEMPNIGTAGVQTCEPTEDVYRAMNVIQATKIRRVPVHLPLTLQSEFLTNAPFAHNENRARHCMSRCPTRTIIMDETFPWIGDRACGSG